MSIYPHNIELRDSVASPLILRPGRIETFHKTKDNNVHFQSRNSHITSCVIFITMENHGKCLL